ncbi:MAG TPA: ABC transporter substrate-binding protein [Myxococcota bacterium]|nr:ABC transporter substrate-binding protein [Myxococcota bacterium]HRY95891.1 ABC transporter substrate-binding protein [Myxococcota bacterium]HSA22410.1 ABC transporter substrate-binding protein [Myxococcota bacterium]
MSTERCPAWLALGLILLAAGCVEPAGGPPADALKVGALLPFTGDIASEGANIERAILQVLDQVNEAGGIAGRPLWLVTKDTHSDLRRGFDAAQELMDEGVVAILGPQDEEMGKQLAPVAATRNVVVISGGVTSPFFSTLADNGFWFRTCPTARELGRAMAERMQADGVRLAQIIYVGDLYGLGLNNILVNELIGRNIQTLTSVSFQPGVPPDFNRLLTPILESKPDAIALMSYASTGAQIVQEWSVRGGQARFYLAPALKADVFLDNVPPGVLDGAVGVAPALGQASITDAFAEDFASRWEGEAPLNAAYFYYDAAMVLVLAMARAAEESGAAPSGAAIRDQVGQVASAPGEQLGWNDLEQAMELAAQGMNLDYEGTTGTVDMDERGDLMDGRVDLWTIRQDRIEALE